MAFKDFANGNPLNATEVDLYLMRQTVMVFADSTARTAALTGIETEGMVTYLSDTNATQYYDGAAWVNLAPDTSSFATLTGTQTLTNKTLTAPTINSASVANPKFNGAALETAYTVGTGFAGYTYYATTNGAIQYITANSTANGTLNVTAASGSTLNSLMATGQTLTVVLMVTNGATPYYPNAYQIDGSAVTPKWSGGTAPTGGNANSIDAYTLTIIKTGSAAFTVLANQTKFA